ncbi:MAG: tripartite tricarboxylate transporter TctB family protein, partial [Desulfobulbaceae bacterium]
PQVVLVVAMFLNAIMMYQSIKNGPDKAKEKGDRDAFWRVVLSMAAAIAFGFGVSYLGTLVSISLFIAAVMLIWGVRKKVTIVLTALITPVVIYLIFTKILLVQLPSGILM